MNQGKLCEGCNFVRLSEAMEELGRVSVADTELLIVAPLKGVGGGYDVIFATELDGEGIRMNHLVPSPNFPDTAQLPVYTKEGDEVFKSLHFRGLREVGPLRQLVELLMVRRSVDITETMSDREEGWEYFRLEEISG